MYAFGSGFLGRTADRRQVSIRPTRQNKRLTSGSTRQRHEDRCDGGDCVDSLRKCGKRDHFHKTRKTGSANTYDGRYISLMFGVTYVKWRGQDSKYLSFSGGKRTF